MADKEIEANLIFLKADYENIPSCITRLDASDILLIKAIGNVNNAKKLYIGIYILCWFFI